MASISNKKSGCANAATYTPVMIGGCGIFFKVSLKCLKSYPGILSCNDIDIPFYYVIK